MNNIRIGIEIQAINNGYIVTGHKTNGHQLVDSGRTYFNTFEEVADGLVNEVRKAFDLAFEEEPGFDFMVGGMN